MAKLDAAMHEHRYQYVIARFEFWIAVDIDHVDLRAELGGKRCKGREHVVAQMTPGPSIQRQPRAARHF